MSLIEKYSAVGTSIFVIVILVLLTQCHRRKEAPNTQQDKVPSTRQLSRFDSLKSVVINNKKLMEVTVRSSGLNGLQQLSITNTINQVAANDLVSITSGLNSDAVDRYLDDLNGMIEQVLATYILKDLDLGTNSVTRDRITELMVLQLEYDSLVAVSEESAVVNKLEKMTMLLHKMDSIRKTDVFF